MTKKVHGLKGYKQTEEHKQNAIKNRVHWSKTDKAEIVTEKISLKNTGKISHRRGVKYEEEYGVEKSNKIKNSLSLIAKQNFIDNPDLSKLISIKTKEAMTEEVCKKISEKITGRIHSESHRINQKNGLKKFFLENPNIRKEYYQKYPEKHINRRMANNHKNNNGYISKPQIKMFEIIKKHYLDVELEYPIKTNNGTRFADVGVPNLKLDFEFNGLYWHKNREKDLQRIKEISEVGWTVISFNENNINCIENFLCFLKYRDFKYILEES